MSSLVNLNKDTLWLLIMVVVVMLGFHCGDVCCLGVYGAKKPATPPPPPSTKTKWDSSLTWYQKVECHLFGWRPCTSPQLLQQTHPKVSAVCRSSPPCRWDWKIQLLGCWKPTGLFILPKKLVSFMRPHLKEPSFLDGIASPRCLRKYFLASKSSKDLLAFIRSFSRNF